MFDDTTLFWAVIMKFVFRSVEMAYFPIQKLCMSFCVENILALYCQFCDWKPPWLSNKFITVHTPGHIVPF